MILHLTIKVLLTSKIELLHFLLQQMGEFFNNCLDLEYYKINKCNNNLHQNIQYYNALYKNFNWKMRKINKYLHYCDWHLILCNYFSLYNFNNNLGIISIHLQIGKIDFCKNIQKVNKSYLLHNMIYPSQEYQFFML